MSTEKQFNVLHIYAQYEQHDDAWIVGDLVALTALRDALTRAIETNLPSSAKSFCRDGEGFNTVIIPSDEARMKGMRWPYTATEISITGMKYPYHPDKGVTPYELLAPGRYRELVK